MLKRLLLLAALALLPVHASAKPDLSQLKAQLASKKQSEARIQSQVRDAEKDMAETKKDLVTTAQSVRDNEQQLKKLEDKIAPLVKQEAEINAQLSSSYSAIGDLVLALARMRRVPPELLIVRPGAPLQTAQTATLLGNILPALNKQTEVLADQLKKLSEVRFALEKDRKEVETARATLSKKYAAVSTLAEKRTSLYKKLNTDYETTRSDVERIAQQAANAEELIQRLQEHEEHERTVAIMQEKRARSYAWSTPSSGKPQLPVPGLILTGYGQTDDIGAVSQGLTIRSMPKTLVVAPMDGVVRFSGPFRNYGQLVILEHHGGYTSLIAGFETVDAPLGQALDAGEPIGKLPATSSRGDVPTLYYELRYKGRPVNPSDKFPDLKAKS